MVLNQVSKPERPKRPAKKSGAASPATAGSSTVAPKALTPAKTRTSGPRKRGAVPAKNGRTVGKRSSGGAVRRVIWRVAAPLLLIAAMSIIAFLLASRHTNESDLARYPLEYKPVIEEYCAQYGLDPAFVSAIILCESSYLPDARSGADARGLMQIMPATGQWIAGKLGDDDQFEPDMLYEPQLNIQYGCWYFNYLSERFDGEPGVMAAAYHSGPNLVARWLEDDRYSIDGRTLANIPDTSPQAQKYVARVLEAYDQYKRLYSYDV